jgi:Tfp pilus assembly protein PilV
MSKPPVLQRQRRTIYQQHQQRGTTMIEVMVAALVLSAGLLGLAAMQTKALKTASGLATQQVIFQALGAYSEARLTAPSATGHYTLAGGTIFSVCSGYWLNSPPLYYSQSSSQTIVDMEYLSTFLQTYTPCGNVALTEFLEYANSAYIVGGDKEITASRTLECDYATPVSRRAQCTLPAGDVIELWNVAWVR